MKLALALAVGCLCSSVVLLFGATGVDAAIGFEFESSNCQIWGLWAKGHVIYTENGAWAFPGAPVGNHNKFLLGVDDSDAEYALPDSQGAPFEESMSGRLKACESLTAAVADIDALVHAKTLVAANARYSHHGTSFSGTSVCTQWAPQITFSVALAGLRPMFAALAVPNAYMGGAAVANNLHTIHLAAHAMWANDPDFALLSERQKGFVLLIAAMRVGGNYDADLESPKQYLDFIVHSTWSRVAGELAHNALNFPPTQYQLAVRTATANLAAAVLTAGLPAAPAHPPGPGVPPAVAAAVNALHLAQQALLAHPAPVVGVAPAITERAWLLTAHPTEANNPCWAAVLADRLVTADVLVRYAGAIHAGAPASHAPYTTPLHANLFRRSWNRDWTPRFNVVFRDWVRGILHDGTDSLRPNLLRQTLNRIGNLDRLDPPPPGSAGGTASQVIMEFRVMGATGRAGLPAALLRWFDWFWRWNIAQAGIAGAAFPTRVMTTDPGVAIAPIPPGGHAHPLTYAQAGAGCAATASNSCQPHANAVAANTFLAAVAAAELTRTGAACLLEHSTGTRSGKLKNRLGRMARAARAARMHVHSESASEQGCEVVPTMTEAELAAREKRHVVRASDLEKGIATEKEHNPKYQPPKQLLEFIELLKAAEVEAAKQKKL